MTRYESLLFWLRQPPVLMRWKVMVTAVAVILTAGGLAYQSNYQSRQRQHETDCLRAESRDSVRRVLFEITSLSNVFPDSDFIKLYEESTHTTIDTSLPRILVAGCNQPTVETP